MAHPSRCGQNALVVGFLFFEGGRMKTEETPQVGSERVIFTTEYNDPGTRIIGRIIAKRGLQGKDCYFASVGFDRKPFEAAEQKDVLPNGLALIGELFYERIQRWGGTPDFPLEK
jgi:hypothetical protein